LTFDDPNQERRGRAPLPVASGAISSTPTAMAGNVKGEVVQIPALSVGDRRDEPSGIAGTDQEERGPGK
jgi:hypothetical protein